MFPSMITFLQGSIAEKHPTSAVLDVGGVGYEVFIPLSSYDRLPAKGETCRILTFDYVREDTHQLFGFMTEEERRVFVLLLATNGVGPKLALSALSALSVREIIAAVVAGDVRRLSSVPGIGRKTAERLVVELRDRIGEGEAMAAAAGEPEQDAGALLTRDAVLALIALGYKEDAAVRMVRQAVGRGEPPGSVEEMIRRALSA